MPSPNAAWPRPYGAATTSAVAVIEAPSQGRTDQGEARTADTASVTPTMMPRPATIGSAPSSPNNRATRTATQPAVKAGALYRSTHHHTSHPRSVTSIAVRGRRDSSRPGLIGEAERRPAGSWVATPMRPQDARGQGSRALPEAAPGSRHPTSTGPERRAATRQPSRFPL
jgi:hypothetical protein